MSCLSVLCPIRFQPKPVPPGLPGVDQPLPGAELPPPLPEATDECCGWFDSSFELARGLEVCEQDDDSLLQLWRLAQ